MGPIENSLDKLLQILEEKSQRLEQTVANSKEIEETLIETTQGHIPENSSKSGDKYLSGEDNFID